MRNKMKIKTLSVQVNEDFFDIVEYVGKKYGYGTKSSYVRHLLLKDLKERADGFEDEVLINYFKNKNN